MASKNSALVIKALQADRRMRGICPSCMESFRLRDAALYHVTDTPPLRAQQAISIRLENIRQQKAGLAEQRHKMTTRAEKIVESVNIGKIVEKIVPSFGAFSFNAADCRALFEPIDYLVFSGLARRGKVDALLFVDIKTGGARLTEGQRRIANAVDGGAVSFQVMK